MTFNPALPPFGESGSQVTVLKDQYQTITREFDIPKPGANSARALHWDISFEAGSGAVAGTLSLDVETQNPDGSWTTNGDYPAGVTAASLNDPSWWNGKKARVTATIAQTSGAGVVAATKTAGVYAVNNPLHGEILEVWDGFHPTGPIRIGFYQTEAGDGATPTAVHKKEMNLWMCPISGTPGSTTAADYQATVQNLQDLFDEMQTEGYWAITTADGGDARRLDFTHDVPGTQGNSAYIGVSSSGAINLAQAALAGGSGTGTTVDMTVASTT